MVDDFLSKLKQIAIRKAKLYDGIDSIQKLNDFERPLRFCMEELGEVATAINRERYNLAAEECLDVAHCAMLIYIALRSKEND